MHDQKQLWNDSHNRGELRPYSENPTSFAEEVIKVIAPASKILELGCGVGNDSVAFANAGHTTYATDFSDVVIRKNSERFAGVSNLNFETLDISQPFPYPDNEFDVVYARLSLHYFTDETTRRTISEIHRVLKPAGLLCFICKSVNDPLYGKGEKIEEDMFELDGHARHFFSEPYAKSLLEKNFKIVKIESGNEKFYGGDSAYVKVFAAAVQ